MKVPRKRNAAELDTRDNNARNLSRTSNYIFVHNF
jgi:hypothetical protein